MAELSSLEEGQLVLLGVYYTDRDGRNSTFRRMGAMIAEAVIALVWAAAAQGHYGSSAALAEDPGTEADEQPAGPRTVFAVGDEKQSIYSFQGAAPEMFAEAGRTFKERAEAVSRRFESVPLELSFRTVSPLLTAVDHVFANPSATPGLTSAQDAVRHLVLRQGAAGIFELWDREPVEAAEPEDGPRTAPAT